LIVMLINDWGLRWICFWRRPVHNAMGNTLSMTSKGTDSA